MHSELDINLWSLPHLNHLTRCPHIMVGIDQIFSKSRMWDGAVNKMIRNITSSSCNVQEVKFLKITGYDIENYDSHT